ncbi:alpha-1,6-mannosyl-glycoprotein 2-beta-N-acetylglucosaminyltransferase [Rhipicephalus microplus]|uniref:alpha-1,6-mannosyl-glycoprotein 2-beta-N-acetylglucosaminyltransferase n=1 Tax=Rhipicephalus microplus TaxID=6941 RepID=UPI003F6AA5BD
MWYLRRSLLRLGLLQRPFLVTGSLCGVVILLYSFSDHGPRNVTTPVSSDTVTEPPVALANVEDLRIFAFNLNKRQQVHHEEKFGATLEPSDPVIVVQVHNRWRYLQYLLQSLSAVRGIERALIVFSHDYYDAHMLELPENVTFCRVMQIFFPYSTQLYPHEFPGVHPNDCPRNIHYEQARKIKCNNAEYPDQYGHYRESKFTQIKHHWWWKLNVVMESLNVTRNHEGPIMLLEEDYYVAPDYLDAVRLLLSKRRAGVHRRPKKCQEVLLRKALRVIPKEGFGSERMRNLRSIPPRVIRLPKVSGGWADVRDHQLCVKMTLWGS